jgi:phosphatidylglycerophosphate synthase
MPTKKRVTVAEHIGITATADGTGLPRLRPDGESNRPAVPPTVASCYLAARQARTVGFLYTRTVSDTLGSVVAAIGMRLGAHPTYLTLMNLILGIGGSVAVMAGRSLDRTTPLLVVGVVLWQAAYIFDCADGQLARATGKTSAYGGSVDIFVDVAAQISVVVAVSSVILSRHEIPGLLVALFASAWFLNFVTVLLARGDDQVSHSLIARGSALVSVAKLLRDYGFVILVLGAWLAVSPSTIFVPVMAVTATNLVLLLGYIARAAVLSIRASRPIQDAENRVPAPSGTTSPTSPRATDRAPQGSRDVKR